MNNKYRQGAGSVLVIVLVMLFIITTITLGRSFFTSYVTDRTSKSVYGDLALAMAGNILKEGNLRLSLLANNDASSSTLFNNLRSEDVDFTAEIPMASLPVSQTMLSEYGGYKVLDDEIEVRCLSKHPSSRVLPFFHDSYGLLELSASIQHRQSGTFRRKKEIFSYRRTLTAPPAPLSNYTLMIGDGVFLTDAYGVDNDANKTIDGAISRINTLFTILQEFESKGNELKRALEDKADSSIPPISGQYEDGAKEVQKSIDIIQQTILLKPEVILKDFGEETDSNDKALHYFAPAPRCFYSQEPQINLEDINLPTKVKTRLSLIDDNEKELKEHAGNLKSFIDSKPTNLSPLSGLTDNLCQSTVSTAKEYESLLLKDYKNFQSKLIEIGSTSYPDYLKAFMQLSKIDLLRKATSIITEEDDGTGQDISEKLNKFLDNHDRYSGLIFVQNTTELTINRKFKGRIFLVVERDVVIERATIDNEDSDLLTIASLRKMTLRGPVEASLIPWHSFSSIPGVPIKGNIIFSRLSFIGGPPEEVLAGTITYDPRLAGASGNDEQLFKKHQYISISPFPLAVDVERH